MQVLEAAMKTMLFKKRTIHGEDKYKIINLPSTGKTILTFLQPTLTFASCTCRGPTDLGNAQYWGALGSVAAAALASKRIIVSCGEIVEHDIISPVPT